MREVLLDLLKFLEQAIPVGSTHCGNDLNDHCSKYNCSYFDSCLRNANLGQQLKIIKENIKKL